MTLDKRKEGLGWGWSGILRLLVPSSTLSRGSSTLLTQMFAQLFQIIQKMFREEREKGTHTHTHADDKIDFHISWETRGKSRGSPRLMRTEATTSKKTSKKNKTTTPLHLQDLKMENNAAEMVLCIFWAPCSRRQAAQKVVVTRTWDGRGIVEKWILFIAFLCHRHSSNHLSRNGYQRLRNNFWFSWKAEINWSKLNALRNIESYSESSPLKTTSLPNYRFQGEEWTFILTPCTDLTRARGPNVRISWPWLFFILTALSLSFSVCH